MNSLDWSVFAQIAEGQMSMCEAAVAYRAAGFQICAVTPRGKRPVHERENGIADTVSSDVDLANSAFVGQPPCNLGLRTGEGFWVLDVDGERGERSLQWLQKYAHVVSLDSALRIKSPNGMHYYFKCDLQEVVPTSVAVLPGVDVRGDLGMIVAPPSFQSLGAEHRYNVSYTIIEDSLCEPDYAPPGLFELCMIAPEIHGSPTVAASDGRRRVSSNGSNRIRLTDAVPTVAPLNQARLLPPVYFLSEAERQSIYAEEDARGLAMLNAGSSTEAETEEDARDARSFTIRAFLTATDPAARGSSSGSVI